MYCVNCGVKLADSEKKCPLCGVAAFHPDIERKVTESTYPQKNKPEKTVYNHLAEIIATLLFLLPLFTVLVCDFQISGGISWSGYVIGALIVLYVSFVLPAWFKNPNPVIFVPVAFTVIGVYVLYINFAVDGDWFLSFGFPAVGGFGLIVTAATVLLRYVKRGLFYILGGTSIAFGAYVVLLEFLMYVTFDPIKFIGWSFYPLITFTLIGGFLIFLAVSRTAREIMERKFFI